MKIVREYKWEMGHRLPFHTGGCRNLHGHSYKVVLEVEGTPDENGIVIDFYDLDNAVKPLLEKLDHSFIAYEKDTELIEVLKQLDSKMVLVDFQSTAENLCNYFLCEIRKTDLPGKIKGIKCLLFETSDCFVQDELVF
ncbi:MAG: 6-carboxytetrahydropterin synthase [Ignavibacteriales bacterium]|jgi:6-pyruvoyltetrahydropterin/6-carboxytetrahydropterin synthase|nr:6-carboxytetrahydropterin synthase [Ignavibacteriaceae bacterium]NLH61746.1 6-carboxytetrahydropterin synthase [Ignavibacteriales bacterium]HOJ19683.1 6-carboxytetrahydropterin synthase [Ignavibacteriaceae bacterium]HPO56563.1 6-carboxytetrahydropterin synthase [Ignavibacteriaceae bacterium]